MKQLLSKLGAGMSFVAGAVLVVMILITFADIVMRFMGSPVPGAYEIVAFLGVAVIGFALPRASLKKTHVYVDLLYDKLTGTPRKALKVSTRVLVFLFFLLAGWALARMGKSYVASHTVTMMLRVPFYPVIFGAALSCFVQCLVSVYEIFEKEGGADE